MTTLSSLKRRTRKSLPMSGTVASFDAGGAQDGPRHPGWLGITLTDNGILLIKIPGCLRVHDRPVWGSPEAIEAIREAMRAHPELEIVCATGVPHPGIEGRMPADRRENIPSIQTTDRTWRDSIPSCGQEGSESARGTAAAAQPEDSQVCGLQAQPESSAHQQRRAIPRGFTLPGRTKR